MTKDAVVVAPGLAHGRARGLQAYLLPTVTIPRARRPHRPPTLSLSHTPLKRRRSAGVSVTRRIAGPGAFRGYPHGLTLRVQRGRVRLQWRPATALSYGSLHSTCTAIPPGPRPPSLVAGVYHTSSPRAAVSLGVPSLILKVAHAPASQRHVNHGPCVGVSRPSGTGMPAHHKRRARWAVVGIGAKATTRGAPTQWLRRHGVKRAGQSSDFPAQPCSAFDGTRTLPWRPAGSRPSSPS